MMHDVLQSRKTHILLAMAGCYLAWQLWLTIAAPRLYALPGAPTATPGEMLLLTLTTATPGLEIFSFTFESCAEGCGR